MMGQREDEIKIVIKDIIYWSGGDKSYYDNAQLITWIENLIERWGGR